MSHPPPNAVILSVVSYGSLLGHSDSFSASICERFFNYDTQEPGVNPGLSRNGMALAKSDTGSDLPLTAPHEGLTKGRHVFPSFCVIHRCNRRATHRMCGSSTTARRFPIQPGRISTHHHELFDEDHYLSQAYPGGRIKPRKYRAATHSRSGKPNGRDRVPR